MIGETRITQAGPDGEDSPVLHVLHDRDFTQTLYDRVVVHQHHCLVWSDLGDRLTQTSRKVETIAQRIDPARLPADPS
jgi:hypothetical protein